MSNTPIRLQLQVVIIHRFGDAERYENLRRLVADFPGAIVLPADTADWECTKERRATRGCALSHLNAVNRYLTPNTAVLVLEDDAVYRGPRPVRIPLDNLPSDAGAIALGGDTEATGLVRGDWYEVVPKWWGSHAVVYLPILGAQGWLDEAALQLTAVPSMAGDGGACYESALLTSLKAVGSRCYRHKHHTFTTLPTMSSRTGQFMDARSTTLDLA